MKKKMKRFVGIVLLSVMVCSLTGNISVLANNCQDTTYNINFDNSPIYTPAMKAADCNGIYVKCVSITNNGSFDICLAGCKTAASQEGADCLGEMAYTIHTAGQCYYITSLAEVKGYDYVRLAFFPNYAHRFSASLIMSMDKK